MSSDKSAALRKVQRCQGCQKVYQRGAPEQCRCGSDTFIWLWIAASLLSDAPNREEPAAQPVPAAAAVQDAPPREEPVSAPAESYDLARAYETSHHDHDSSYGSSDSSSFDSSSSDSSSDSSGGGGGSDG